MDDIDEHSSNEPKAIGKDGDIPKKLNQIFDFIDFMKSHVDIARDFRVDTWADVEFLACHSEKRIPGLGTELVVRAVQKMQEVRVKVGERLCFISATRNSSYRWSLSMLAVIFPAGFL
mgnify:CR=1 FL=1